MKYKIAICDDDAEQRAYVSDLVTLWAKKNRHLTEIKKYAEAKAFLFDWAEEKDFDILLLDIEMPEVNGIDLAKAVRRENSTPVLDKAVNNLMYRQRSVLLSTAEGDIKVSLADILYVESENVYIIVHTPHGNYRTRMTLSKFIAHLDETFFKVHRSFVVGLKYIKKITRTDITMINGDIVPISRGMYDEVHAAVIKHL